MKITALWNSAAIPGPIPVRCFSVALVLLLAACKPAATDSGPEPSWKPERSTPGATIASAIAAMEREDYSAFPTILSLTYHLYLLEHGAARQETESMTDEDFERTLTLLRELRGKKPAYKQGGNLAVFKAPGLKLPGDNFHMIRYGGKWYFLVE